MFEQPLSASQLALREYMKYPVGFNFWNIPGIKEEGKKIQIVNEQDFPRDQILRSLKIDGSKLVSGFGITDVNEIRNRQEVMKYIVENPGFRDWLISSERESPLPGMAYAGAYEEAARDFLDYFDPEKSHTPFWEGYHAMLEYLTTSGNLPQKLQVFRDVLMMGLPLELYEKDLGGNIGEMIQNMADFEGFAEFQVTSKEVKEKGVHPFSIFKICKVQPFGEVSVHGFKKFSKSALAADRIDSAPYWATDSSDWRCRLGIGRVARWIAARRDVRAKEEAYQNALVKDVDKGLLIDIANGLQNLLGGKFEWKSDVLIRDSRIRVYFSYSKTGLRVRIISWLPHVDANNVPKFRFADYVGYSKEQVAQIKEDQNAFVSTLRMTQAWSQSSKLLASLEKQDHQLFDREYLFSSPRSDPVYRWYAISNLYRKHFRTEYEVLTLHRDFFFSQKKVLKEMAEVAKQLMAVSREIECPLCWPELVTDGSHVVSFKKLVPIHLLEHLPKDKKLVPIETMPDLNGEILGLTGSHEGGKTTATLAYVELIYLAQSGLPVFGEKVKLNPKSLLGLVFLTKGVGSSSTARTLADKMVRAIDAIKKVDPSEVVLIFDELGEGTQETSGYELGRDVLTALNGRHISVIFNTQIQDLAAYVEKTLGGKCMRFSVDHKIEPGIGTGGMESLRERSGLNDALKCLA